MSYLANRVQHELSRRADENARVSVVGPEAADLRTALVGNAFHQPSYVHDGANPSMMGYIGPAGPTTTIAAPFGYGQDEDKYEGPTFPHVPTVVRPVPLGGIDQYHVASDLPLSTKCTLKEKYEPCAVDHRTGYDRFGNLDYAEYSQRPGYYSHGGFGGPGYGGPYGGAGGYGGSSALYGGAYGPGYAGGAYGPGYAGGAYGPGYASGAYAPGYAGGAYGPGYAPHGGCGGYAGFGPGFNPRIP